MTFTTKVWRLPDMDLVEDLDATTDPTDPRTFDESHEVVVNELGKFQFSTFEVDGLDIQLGDHVAFFEDDLCLGGGVIRQCRTTRVSAGLEGKVVQTWSGVRPIGGLEFGAIRPARSLGSIAQDRVWGWFGVTYDDSGWDTATELVKIDDAAMTSGWFEVTGTDFNDVDAYWVWDSTGTTDFALEGDCYFRQVVTVPSGVTRIEIELLADAQADLYIEGQRELSTEYIFGNPKPSNIRRQQFDVTPGPVLIAVHAINNPDYDFDGLNNPGGVVWSIWSVDSVTGDYDTVLARSDSSVAMVGYPIPTPGVTPGEPLLEVLEEMQAAGYWQWIVPTFTAELDSSGSPWSSVAEFGTKVGYSLWKFVQQLTAIAIDTDLDAEPNGDDKLEWHAWEKGNRGSDTFVEYETIPGDPALSNLQRHEVTETLQRGNQILHYSRFGWWLESAVVDGLKIDATLGLGALESFGAVTAYAQAQLDESSANLVEHDFDILPVDSGDTPIFGYDIGDRITIGGTLQPVVSIDWRRDRNGRLHWDEDG